MIKLHFERFKRLPRNPSAVWEAKVILMPTHVHIDDDPEKDLVRPWAAIVLDHESGLVEVTDILYSRDEAEDALVDMIFRFGSDKSKCGYRPQRIDVSDPALAATLRSHLLGTGVACDVHEKLEFVDAAVDGLREHVFGQEEQLFPCVLDAKGITIDSLRSFAEAAKAFYEASLWDELCDEDLIEIQKPRPPAGMKYVSVLGADGQAFGLGFFKSIDQYWRMFDADHPSEFFRKGKNAIWSFQFGSIDELPLEESEAWRANDLPVADADAYPLLFQSDLSSKPVRPNAKQLAFVEGLLRALAQSDSVDFDLFQWERKAVTSLGTRKYALEMVDDEELGAMPDRRAMESVLRNLEQSFPDLGGFIGEPGKRSGDSSLERAQDLVYQAFEVGGRRRLQLAREALDISEDCADAYVLLAENERDIRKARELYEQGVAAGERILGKGYFENEVGDFWGLLETGPYMRARAGLASCLWADGKRDESVGHYQELLRLNPDDNQGIRYVLAGSLLELGRDKELKKLLDTYAEDSSAVWVYIQALVAYKQNGDSPESRKRIREALQANQHVPDYLLGRKIPPSHPQPYYSPGQDSEAVVCVDEILPGWKKTPGALEWLEEVVEAE